MTIQGPVRGWPMTSASWEANVTGDLRELWRRLVFSLLVSNYDDHLRNHGFLMHRPGRWVLTCCPFPLSPR